MSDKDITKAIISILKKELGGVIDLIPNNLIEIEETIIKESSFIESLLEYFNWN